MVEFLYLVKKARPDLVALTSFPFIQEGIIKKRENVSMTSGCYIWRAVYRNSKNYMTIEQKRSVGDNNFFILMSMEK